MVNKEQKNQFIKEKIETHSLFPKSRRQELLELLDPGEFPVDSFPENIQEWMAYFKNEFGYPEPATGMIMLSLLSTAIGPLLQVIGASPHGPTPLNIWTVIVAQRGSGKSHLSKELARPVIEADRSFRRQFAEIRAKAEVKIEELKALLPRNRGKNSADSLSTAGIYEQIRSLESIRGLNLIIGTATPEALTRTVAESIDCFAGIFSAEGGETFDTADGKYNDSGYNCLGSLLSLKSGDFINELRIKRDSVTVYGGYVSMLLLVQDFVAKRLLQHEAALMRGLFSRTHFIDPKFVRNKIERKNPIAMPNENIVADAMSYYVNERIRIANGLSQNILDGLPIDRDAAFQPKFIECDPAAADLLVEFYNEGVEVERALAAVDRRIPGECSRWREDAIQFSGLFAALFYSFGFNRDAAQKAINLVRWNKKNFLTQFLKHNLEGISDKFEHLEGIIEKSPNGQVTVRDLKLRNGFTAEDIATLQHLYGDEIEIVTVKPSSKKGGRPSTVIRFR
jgi:hypothetical protein